MKRAVLGVGDCLSARRGGFRSQWVMVTLTLRPGCTWHPKMVNDYLQAVRRWARSRGTEIPYVWVAELQADRMRRTGEKVECVVHYHVVFRLAAGVSMPQADRRGWWPHGMSRTEVARKPVAYLAKYVSKGDEQEFPRGIRIFGIGGLDASEREFRRWWCAPLYVRGSIAPEDQPMRCTGGYLARATGEFARSPFAVHIRRNEFTNQREVWIEDREGRSAAEFAAFNKSSVEASRVFAARAGFTWLQVPAGSSGEPLPVANDLT